MRPICGTLSIFWADAPLLYVPSAHMSSQTRPLFFLALHVHTQGHSSPPLVTPWLSTCCRTSSVLLGIVEQNPNSCLLSWAATRNQCRFRPVVFSGAMHQYVPWVDVLAAVGAPFVPDAELSALRSLVTYSQYDCCCYGNERLCRVYQPKSKDGM